LCLKLLSDELRDSLEEQKKALKEQLTSESTQLRRELETIRDEKKEVEIKLENHRKTSGEQIDRQRQGIPQWRISLYCGITAK